MRGKGEERERENGEEESKARRIVKGGEGTREGGGG